MRKKCIEQKKQTKQLTDTDRNSSPPPQLSSARPDEDAALLTGQHADATNGQTFKHVHLEFAIYLTYL